jgi:hypothetical protein
MITATDYGLAADRLKKYEVWVTGDIFEQNLAGT